MDFHALSIPRLQRSMKFRDTFPGPLAQAFAFRAVGAAIFLTAQSIRSMIFRMSLASIHEEIEKLEPAERATLIDVLWDSLDGERVKELEAKWAAESDKRIDAFERGDLTAVDGPSAIEELRSSLGK